MAQLDGHRNLGEARVRSRVTAHGICGAESDIEEGVFSPITSDLHCQYNSSNTGTDVTFTATRCGLDGLVFELQ
jgi:hypothetical protein